MLGVDRKLTQLIAAGTSICGASAVIATNTVTEAHDEDVAYAVACVTIFGSLAMFSYPLLPGLVLHVREAGGVLQAQASGQGAFVMEPAAKDVFRAPAYGIELRFLRGDDGAVRSLELHQAGQVLRGVRG